MNEMTNELYSSYISFVRSEAYKDFKNQLLKRRNDWIECFKSELDVNRIFEMKGKLLHIDEILEFFDDLLKVKQFNSKDLSRYDSSNYDLEVGTMDDLESGIWLFKHFYI